MLDINNAKHVEIKKGISGGSNKTYTFKCTDCDNDIKCQQSKLKTHSGKCRKCAQKKKPYEHILNELKYRSKKRSIKHSVELSYDEFIKIIENSKCHYCNKELVFNPYTRDENSNYVSRAYQLDRKDNNLGYTVENVVPCCWNCNRIKSDIYSYEDFIKLSPTLKEIHKNR